MEEKKIIITNRRMKSNNIIGSQFRFGLIQFKYVTTCLGMQTNWIEWFNTIANVVFKVHAFEYSEKEGKKH